MLILGIMHFLCLTLSIFYRNNMLWMSTGTFLCTGLELRRRSLLLLRSSSMYSHLRPLLKLRSSESRSQSKRASPCLAASARHLLRPLSSPSVSALLWTGARGELYTNCVAISQVDHYGSVNAPSVTPVTHLLVKYSTITSIIASLCGSDKQWTTVKTEYM